MSDTPRTDAEEYDAIANTNSALLANDVQAVVPAEFARKLELELAAPQGPTSRGIQDASDTEGRAGSALPKDGHQLTDPTWDAIVAALNEVYGGTEWLMRHKTGTECAVSAIKELCRMRGR